MPSDVIYSYDGSYDGFLCCVFESYAAKEAPWEIWREDRAQGTLFPVKEIVTDPVRAKRVAVSIPKKMSREAAELVRDGFLCELPDKEKMLLDFLRLGYRVGRRLTKLTAHEAVDRLGKAVLQMRREAQFCCEFLRFSQYGDFLGAVMSPKHNALPIVVQYFCDRMPSENFVIYDEVHRSAFFHKESGELGFLYETRISFPEPGAEEIRYRKLWKQFHRVVAVEGRINPKLQKGNMPMRYWKNVTEFQEDASPAFPGPREDGGALPEDLGATSEDRGSP